MRVLVLGTGAGQADGLVLEDVPVLRHGMLLDRFELGVVASAASAETQFKIAFNFPQGMGAAQLAEEHRDELAPAQKRTIVTMKIDQDR